jgi:hypothetical protein
LSNLLCFDGPPTGRTRLSDWLNEHADSVIIENMRHPGQGKRVDGAMYRAMRTAMLEVLPASAPGLNWSEQRAQGVINFMEDYKKANPNREVTVERIDSGTDLAVVSDRVGAYLNAHPETTAYFDTGFWHAGVARVLADRGVAVGKGDDRLVAGPLVAAEDDALAYVLGKAAEAQIEVEDVWVVQVLDANEAYLEAIGAIGPVVDPEP